MSDVARVVAITLPTPFPVGPVNVYVIGDPPVIVDCGANDDKTKHTLTRELSSCGIDIKGVVGVVCTHAHPDHSGAAGWIGDVADAPVYVHEAEHQLLVIDTGYVDNRKRLMAKAGMPISVIDSIAGLMTDGQGLIAPVMHRVEPLPDHIQSWRVIHTPGHTAGHICLYNEQSKDLICGDCLLPGMLPSAGHELTSGPADRPLVTTYIDTMADLRDLDVKTVYPGHGNVVSDHVAIIDKWHAHRQRRQNRLLQALEQGPATAYEIVHRLRPDLAGRALYSAVADALAWLESMICDGRVEGRQVDSVVIYERSS